MKKQGRMVWEYVLVVFLTIVFLVLPAFAQEKHYKFKLGHVFAPINANHVAALKYAETIKNKTKGTVEISVFPGGQLGGDRELGEGLQRGTLEMGFVHLMALAGFDRRLQIGTFPFLTSSYATADRQYFKGGWVGNSMKKWALESGWRVLAFTENDFKQFTNSRRPIKIVEDLKGLKIRVPESPIMTTYWKALGAIVTPIAFPELYTALQQKTVDGQENGILLTYSSRLYEVQPYMTLSNYVYAPCSIVVSEKVWKTLPVDIQKTLQETAPEISGFQVDLNRKDVQKCREAMEKAGVQIIEMPKQEIKKLREKAMEVWNTEERYLSKEVLEQMKKEAVM